MVRNTWISRARSRSVRPANASRLPGGMPAAWSASCWRSRKSVSTAKSSASCRVQAGADRAFGLQRCQPVERAGSADAVAHRHEAHQANQRQRAAQLQVDAVLVIVRDDLAEQAERGSVPCLLPAYLADEGGVGRGDTEHRFAKPRRQGRIAVDVAKIEEDVGR